MLWLSYALGTCTSLWIGHGCYCYRMLSEHEHKIWAWMLWLSFALGTRMLPWVVHGCAIVCSRNTNVIMVWAWSHFFGMLSDTNVFMFGHGCAIVSVLSEPSMPLFIAYALKLCSRNTNIITVWAWMRDSMLSEHERCCGLDMDALFIVRRMLSEHECYCGLGMDALVIVCSRNTNVIMVWAWNALFIVRRMLSEHECYCGLGVDALVIVCSRNTNVIMVWAWMHL